MAPPTPSSSWERNGVIILDFAVYISQLDIKKGWQKPMTCDTFVRR
jgi:hypothetical protein